MPPFGSLGFASTSAIRRFSSSLLRRACEVAPFSERDIVNVKVAGAAYEICYC